MLLLLLFFNEGGFIQARGGMWVRIEAAYRLLLTFFFFHYYNNLFVFFLRTAGGELCAAADD